MSGFTVITYFWTEVIGTIILTSFRHPNQPTAADVVNTLDEKDLYKILRKYGEEKEARHIARTIVNSRYAFGDITTTGQLAKIISTAFHDG